MRSEQNQGVGESFFERLDLPAEKLEYLFLILLCTITCTAVLGNMLYWDRNILQISFIVGAISILYVAVLYAFTTICKSVAWGVICLFGLLLGIVYLRSAWINLAFYALAFPCCIYMLRIFKQTRTEFRTSIAAGVIGAVSILGVEGAYTSFNMLKRLGADAVHQDTLFHASIAAMIKNYGIASTGLHGLVETPYHILSHWFIAATSSLSTVGVLEVYGLGPQLFFIPLLFFALVYCCLVVNKQKSKSDIVMLWALSCFALTVIPHLFAKSFGIFNSYFLSESYTVSLGLLLVGMPLLFIKRLTFAETIAFCLITVLMALAKISVGVIYLGLWWIRSIFFLRKGGLRTILPTLLLSLFTVCIMFKQIQANASLLSVQPFQYISYYSFWGKYILKAYNAYSEAGIVNIRYLTGAIISVISFLAVHFGVSWLVVAQSFCKTGWLGMWNSPIALYSLGAIGAGFLSVALSIPSNSSVYYFSNVAFFVSLPAALLIFHTILNQINAAVVINYASLHQLRFTLADIKTRPGLLLGTVFFLVLAIGANPLRHLYAQHAQIKNKQNAFLSSLVKVRNSPEIDQYLSASSAFLALNPVARKTARPFVFPAVSERPWINIVPDNIAPEQYEYYGYEQYGISPLQQRISVKPVLNVGAGRTLRRIEVSFDGLGGGVGNPPQK